MPVATLSNPSLCQSLSREYAHSPVLTTYLHIDTSSVVHLRSSSQNLPDSSMAAFSLSLTTFTLNQCRIRRFEPSIWLQSPRGPPSSLVQQERLLSFVMTHERSGIGVHFKRRVMRLVTKHCITSLVILKVNCNNRIRP